MPPGARPHPLDDHDRPAGEALRASPVAQGPAFPRRQTQSHVQAHRRRAAGPQLQIAARRPRHLTRNTVRSGTPPPSRARQANEIQRRAIDLLGLQPPPVDSTPIKCEPLQRARSKTGESSPNRTAAFRSHSAGLGAIGGIRRAALAARHPGPCPRRQSRRVTRARPRPGSPRGGSPRAGRAARRPGSTLRRRRRMPAAGTISPTSPTRRSPPARSSCAQRRHAARPWRSHRAGAGERRALPGADRRAHRPRRGACRGGGRIHSRPHGDAASRPRPGRRALLVANNISLAGLTAPQVSRAERATAPRAFRPTSTSPPRSASPASDPTHAARDLGRSGIARNMMRSRSMPKARASR